MFYLGRTDTSVDKEVAKKSRERRHVPWRLLGESWDGVTGRGETPLQDCQQLPEGHCDFSNFRVEAMISRSTYP
jgi:hypothetical protein